MKIAHSVVVTPGRCGLYNTTVDLVKALRKKGIDSRLVDPDPKNNPVYQNIPEQDEGIPIESTEWFNQADIVVSHSGLGSLKIDRPRIHVAHGRPRSSFIGEVNNKTPIYSYSYNESKKGNFQAVVTFWPEHKPYWEVMWHPVPVYVVSAPADLNKWTPEGPKGYKFGGRAGRLNIVCTDPWRDDIDPYKSLNLFALYNRKYPGAKLHIYAHENKKGWGALIKKIQDENGIGEIKPWVKGLANVYRAADLTLTDHTIAVRTIRESTACGCPVLSVTECMNPDIINHVIEMTDRSELRQKAVERYNPELSADQFIEVVGGIIR